MDDTNTEKQIEFDQINIESYTFGIQIVNAILYAHFVDFHQMTEPNVSPSLYC